MRMHKYGHKVALMHKVEPSALCNRVPIRVHLRIKTRSRGYSVLNVSVLSVGWMASSAETERFCCSSKWLQRIGTAFQCLLVSLKAIYYLRRTSRPGTAWLVTCYYLAMVSTATVIHCRALPCQAQLCAFLNLAVHDEGEKCHTNAIRTMIRVEASSASKTFCYNTVIIESKAASRRSCCIVNVYIFIVIPLHNILVCNINLVHTFQLRAHLSVL